MPRTSVVAQSTSQVKTVKFSPIQARESLILSHPSHLSNTYEPGPEYIIQPPLIIGESNISIEIVNKTSSGQKASKRQRIASQVRKFLYRPSKLVSCQFDGEYLYDARHIYSNNMAHLIQHHISSLCFAKKMLGLGSSSVKVILNEKPPEMARKVFNLLGYETLETNADVVGQFVSVSIDESNFFHLLPCLELIENIKWLDHTPDKIFISRRKNRLVKNESELVGVLSDMGYQRLFFEELSIIEQWSTVRNASEIVAIHGAALGALAFKMCGGVLDYHLVELFGSGFVVNPFRKYCAAISTAATWIGCRGRLEPNVVRDIDKPGLEKSHAFDSFEISPEIVELAIMRRGRMATSGS